MYKLIKKEGNARRGRFTTVHGSFETPAFMNVATCAAIKGGLSALDLKDLKCQVMLSNTYHLHLRPGDENVKALGGLHKFTKWDGPIPVSYTHLSITASASIFAVPEGASSF